MNILQNMETLVSFTWSGVKRKHNGPRGRREHCNSNQCSKPEKTFEWNSGCSDCALVELFALVVEGGRVPVF